MEIDAAFGTKTNEDYLSIFRFLIKISLRNGKEVFV